MRSLEGAQQGQVIVEVLLILPVFLALVFLIMEIGHLAFRTILIHHAAYEAARVGSLTVNVGHTATQNCQDNPVVDESRIRSVAHRFLPQSEVSSILVEPTVQDLQDHCTNHDVVVTIREAVPLVFVPLTGIFLGKACDGSKSVQVRCIEGTVQMPIERPLFQ